MTVLAGREALAAAAPVLDPLLDAVAAPLWCRRTWLQAYADTSPEQVRVVLLPDGDGAAALGLRRRGPVVAVTALGTGPSDETRLPVAGDDAARRLAGEVHALLRGLGRPWSLRLEQLPPGDRVLAALAERLPGALVEPGDGLPRVELDPSGEPNRHLSRNARQGDNAVRNRLARDGRTLREAWTEDPAQVRTALPELSRVHRARDAALGRRSDHDDPAARAFWELVVLRHAEQGLVGLSTLHVDDDLAAYSLCFRDGPRLGVWDTRMSPAYSGVGRLEHNIVLRHALADPRLQELDWMRGEEGYKLRTATRTDATVGLRAWSSPALRLPSYAGERGRSLRATSPLARRVFTALGKPLPHEDRS